MAAPHRSRARRRRILERELTRLRRAGAELAGPWLELSDLLLEDGEEAEAWRQLEELLATLAELPGEPARLARVRTRLWRIRFHQQDGEAYEAAFAELDPALDELRKGPAPSGELAELEVELWIHLGRLLLLSGQPSAGEALRRARELASALEEPRGWLLELRAHREQAIAAAHDSIEQGLEELARAERRVTERPVPLAERELLVATRAELLANAGRFAEALRLLSEAAPEGPPWAIAQRATTYDLAGEPDAARRAGVALIELLSGADPRDLAARLRLAEALLLQARRVDQAEERAGLAARAARMLEDEEQALPRRGLRMLARAQELLASTLRDPEEAHDLLMQRLHLLEAIARDSPASRDKVELVRSYLQLGDGLLALGRPREARRLQRWALAELRRWPEDHGFVQDVLPLALNAYAHALAAEELWLPARQHIDEARRMVGRRTAPEALRSLAEVLSFRAVACVNLGDSEAAAAGLKRDIAVLLGVALRQRDEQAGDLLDAVIELYLLRAEILVDHLDEIDEALRCYDQAIQLRGMTEEPPPSAIGTLLGAKGVVLNEVGRYSEALPVLQRSLEAFERSEPLDPFDVALARVNLASTLSGLGKPREALDEIGRAGALLDELEAGEEEEADELDDEEEPDEPRAPSIRSSLHMERGEALRHVGHPLLAVDEFSRTVELCRRMLDEQGDGAYEAILRLPEALLRRARCLIDAGGDHAREADADLREAHRRFTELVSEEGRPVHRRRLDEVRELQGRLAVA